MTVSNKIDGKPCGVCGATLRYISSGKCVACMSAGGKRRFAERIERIGNHKVGLPAGFVKFGTTAHRVLTYIHANGPAGQEELSESLEARDISTILRRLTEFGFLFKIGRGRNRPGVRSFAVFSLSNTRSGFRTVRVLTGAERMRDYRARKRVKVPSVFEWRGSL